MMTLTPFGKLKILIFKHPEFKSVGLCEDMHKLLKMWSLLRGEDQAGDKNSQSHLLIFV